MRLSYLIPVLFFTGVLAVPLNNDEHGERVIRSPTFKKKPLGFLFGGLGGGSGTGGGTHGGDNYITNINNYGPGHESYNNHNNHDGHGYGGESFAGSAAVAGGHGGGQAQSQSASFSLGPYTASFSQSQAQSKGYNPYFDY